MTPDKSAEPDVSPALLEAITSFPIRRTVRHCGAEFTTGPLDLYATCPVCGVRVKVRGFTGAPEIEDVFDAVLGWMLRPGAEAAARERLAGIAADPD
ncbi:MAG TPA: hypothetical protein VH092_18335 [Urbifossiella sp.]|jgi:hypothetical protein|nr:hypothetical protein [Urbifossiella sp.]